MNFCLIRQFTILHEFLNFFSPCELLAQDVGEDVLEEGIVLELKCSFLVGFNFLPSPFLGCFLVDGLGLLLDEAGQLVSGGVESKLKLILLRTFVHDCLQ